MLHLKRVASYLMVVLVVVLSKTLFVAKMDSIVVHQVREFYKYFDYNFHV